MKDLLSHLTVRPWLFSLLLVCTFFANLLGLALSVFVLQVLNRYVSFGVDSTLATLTLGALLAVGLEFGFRVARLRLAACVAAQANRDLTLESFGRLTSLSVETLSALSLKLRQALAESVGAVRAVRSATTLSIILDAPFALMFIGVLALFSPLLAVITLGFSILTLGFGVHAYQRLRAPTQDAAAERAACGDIVAAAASNPDTVRLFGGGDILRRRWAERTWSRDYLDFLLVQVDGGIQTALTALAGVLGILVISVGAIQVVRGELDVGLLIASNILAGRALISLVRLVRLSEVFAKANFAKALLTPILALPLPPAGSLTPKSAQGNLEASNLAYVFSGRSDPVFEGLTFSLNPGQVAVVTGANGAGKTTLARLITGLLTPARGEILVNGVALAQLSPAWWRQRLLYLPQEPHFLPLSIRDNLLAFNPDLTAEAMAAVIDKAGLKRFIDHSPTGLDTLLTTYSEHLPVGMRRRLALARALCSQGPFVVLDEPTEALDAEGRAIMLTLIAELKRAGRVVICCSVDAQVVALGDVLIDLNNRPFPQVHSAANLRASMMRTLTASTTGTGGSS